MRDRITDGGGSLPTQYRDGRFRPGSMRVHIPTSREPPRSSRVNPKDLATIAPKTWPRSPERPCTRRNVLRSKRMDLAVASLTGGGRKSPSRLGDQL
jgi:hypothetical protein